MRARHLAGQHPSGPDRGLLVGRVGALAVALGVGTAVMGLTAVAAADTGPDGTAGSAGQEATRSGDSGSATSRTRAGSRRGAATDTAANPAPAAGRRSAGPRSGTVVKGVPASTGTSAVSVPQSPADLIGALLTPGGMTRLVQQAMTSLIGDLISGVSVDALMPEAALTPEITSAPLADVAVAEAPVMTAQPDALSVTATDPLDALGGNGTDSPLATPLSWAAVAASRQDPAAATPEVAPAATVTTGEPVDAAALAGDIAAADPAYQPFPELPVPTGKCQSKLTCDELYTGRALIVTNLANSVADALKLERSAKCEAGKGCPIDPTTKTVSVADSIAMYGFNVVYALMGGLTDATVATTVTQLVSQPGVLDFVSTSVALQFPNLPKPVANLIGTAAATFVSNTFGTDYVALQFVPFLRALNLPTGYGAAGALLYSLKYDKYPTDAILKLFNPTQGQQALIKFFSTTGVQTAFGNAFADSVNVLLVPTVANYIGEQAATDVLGADSTDLAALSATIGGAVSGLFSSIGGIVATEAGKAFVVLLNAPGQDVPTKLANTIDNTLVTFLIGQNPNPAKPIPFPNQPDLIPSLAPAAGVAATYFVQSVLSNPAVPPALGTFINTLVPGMLSNAGVQQKLGKEATRNIDNTVIATAVSGAVTNLIAVPAVQTELATLVNALGANILNSPAAVSALATAAGLWVREDLAQTLTPDAKTQIINTVRKTPAVYNAVGQSVSSGVTALFGNTEVLAAVNSAAVSLVTTLLSEPTTQTAIGEQVGTEVAKLFTNAALGQAVGGQASTAVVRLLGNPAIRSALVALVDTVFSDFFKAPGVLPAFATAAGDVAAAEVALNPSAAKAAQEAFKANPDVQRAVGAAVGGAVRTLLTDPSVIVALDDAAGFFVNGLLSEASVQGALSTAVSTDVSKFLGGGPFGDAVGARAGTAVADLLREQAVRDAVAGLVDTELGDFFTADGVVDAFVAAANTFALDAISNGDTAAAARAAEASLRASTAVQDAVGGIVTTSVAELLTDATLWSTIDTAAANLVGDLLANPAVQTGVHDKVYAAVSTALKDTPFATAVASQVSDAVVDLMKNPVISAGLVGVVDTVLSDFFGTDGVVTAFSTAAGQLASAAVANTFPATEKQVQAELRTNPAVQQGVNNAVGDAVTSLLTSQSVVSALNDKLASLMSDLLGDPDVQAGLDEVVTKDVSKLVVTLFGNDALGDAVGKQVGTAVVEIISNPTVKDALEGLVDTELGDFFRSQGVAAAFASAADTFALEVLTGGKVEVAAQNAVHQLRTSPAIDTAVQTIVTATVSELLGNANVWEAVDGTTSFLVQDLLADPDVQEAVYENVYTNIWVAFNGTALGEVVGDKVAKAVVSLMKNPNVTLGLVGLVDTTTADFFGYPGVVDAFAAAAGEIAAADVAGGPDISKQVLAELRANTAVDQAAGFAVGDAVETLLTDDSVLSALDTTAAGVVTDLLTNPTVQAKLNEQIIKDISKAVGGGDLGNTVGTQVADAVDTFLSNPSVRVALVGLVDDELGNFFRSAGVVSAFSEAADMFAIEVVTGVNVAVAADDAITWLRNSAPVQDAVIGVITESTAALLSNSYVIQAADSGLTTLLTNLGPYAGQLVTLYVTRSMPDSPIAAPVGQALGAAVDQLLAVPGFGSGVVTIIASAVPDFLGQFGVPTAIAGVVGDYAAALVAGEDPAVARRNAERALETNPTLDSAAKNTVADSLTLANLNLLSNPAIRQALGATVTTLITTLAADEAVRTFIAERDGDAVAELLANTAVIGEMASAVGSVVSQLLGYPGFNAALLGAVNQYADDLIDGIDGPTAEQNAVKALQSAPATVAAVNSVVPPAISTLLGYPNVRQAVGLYADEATISLLQQSRFNIAFLDNSIGKVADGTVESLLARTAGVTLVDRLVVSIILGMPVKDWRGFTTQEIIADPFLQIAVGMSLGQGIGSLFGDNIFGDLIGAVAAVPATLVIGATSAVLGFVELIFGRPTYGPSPAAARVGSEHSHQAQQASFVDDLYIWNSVIRDLGPLPV